VDSSTSCTGRCIIIELIGDYSVTVPEPDVMVNQTEFLDAVPVATVLSREPKKLSVPPTARFEVPIVGLNKYEHPVPFCCTVNVLFATLTVPVRKMLLLFEDIE